MLQVEQAPLPTPVNGNRYTLLDIYPCLIFLSDTKYH